MRFDGGLSIEIRRLGDQDEKAGFWGGLKNSLAHWWTDAKAVLSRSSPEADDIRFRITLQQKDADSFYRALPPNTRLFVLPSPEP